MRRILAPVFKRLGIIEQWGNGIKLVAEELRNYPETELSCKEPGIAFPGGRDIQVMLDHDLAEMYQVEVKCLNEQVKRNIERFPESFRFQLTDTEKKLNRSQIATGSIQ